MFARREKLKTSKVKFTEEEDKIIIEHAILYHEKRWDFIASKLINRNGQQVRERYVNYLKSNLTKEPWTSEEEEQLINLVSQYNQKWSQIVKFFPGRTDVLIKNHYNKIKTKPLPPISNETFQQNHQFFETTHNNELSFDVNLWENDSLTWDSSSSNDYNYDYIFRDTFFD
jgi:hypothetical protein